MAINWRRLMSSISKQSIWFLYLPLWNRLSVLNETSQKLSCYEMWYGSICNRIEPNRLTTIPRVAVAIYAITHAQESEWLKLTGARDKTRWRGNWSFAPRAVDKLSLVSWSLSVKTIERTSRWILRTWCFEYSLECWIQKFWRKFTACLVLSVIRQYKRSACFSTTGMQQYSSWRALSKFSLRHCLLSNSWILKCEPSIRVSSPSPTRQIFAPLTRLSTRSQIPDQQEL